MNSAPETMVDGMVDYDDSGNVITALYAPFDTQRQSSMWPSGDEVTPQLQFRVFSSVQCLDRRSRSL